MAMAAVLVWCFCEEDEVPSLVCGQLMIDCSEWVLVISDAN